MLEDALNVATDPDYKFDLAVQLGKLEMAKVVFFRMTKHVIVIIEGLIEYMMLMGFDPCHTS